MCNTWKAISNNKLGLPEALSGARPSTRQKDPIGGFAPSDGAQPPVPFRRDNLFFMEICTSAGAALITYLPSSGGDPSRLKGNDADFEICMKREGMLTMRATIAWLDIFYGFNMYWFETCIINKIIILLKIFNCYNTKKLH